MKPRFDKNEEGSIKKKNILFIHVKNIYKVL